MRVEKMSKKPYVWSAMEWMEFSRRKDWNDPTVNPDDNIPYSEFQRPYNLPPGVDNYQADEWTWPTTDWPKPEVTIDPDPLKHPCNIEDDCMAVGIIGPDSLDCGDCYTFTHVHVIESCELQWWMAYGNWYIKGDPGFCYQLFESPIMTTICCNENVEGMITLIYEGPLGCDAEHPITVGCDECCEDIELIGSDTVTSGDPWIGTISPACSGLECNVSSNSGCDIGCQINPQGSQVLVATDPDDCGSFTVTVTQAPSGDCEGDSATKTVRLSEGNWEACNALALGGEHQCYGNTWTDGEYRATVGCGTGGFGFINARDCDGNIIHRFDYIPDCCDGCGGCYTQHFTRAYASQIWSCTC
jgi:hypothetical protein